MQLRDYLNAQWLLSQTMLSTAAQSIRK